MDESWLDGGEGSPSACLPAYFKFLPFFAEFDQNFVKILNAEISRNSLSSSNFLSGIPHNSDYSGKFWWNFRRKIFDVARRFSEICKNQKTFLKSEICGINWIMRKEKIHWGRSGAKVVGVVQKRFLGFRLEPEGAKLSRSCRFRQDLSNEYSLSIRKNRRRYSQELALQNLAACLPLTPPLGRLTSPAHRWGAYRPLPLPRPD